VFHIFLLSDITGIHRLNSQRAQYGINISDASWFTDIWTFGVYIKLRAKQTLSVHLRSIFNLLEVAMNTLFDQTANQELARQYRANMQEKSIRARLIQEKDPAERPAPRKKSFRQVVKPKIAFGMAVVALTLILIAQNVAVAAGGGGGGGIYLVM